MNGNSLIFRLVPNEVEFCLKVLAPLVHDWVLTQLDTILVVLSNCYWMSLLDAQILQKLFDTMPLDLLLQCPDNR